MTPNVPLVINIYIFNAAYFGLVFKFRLFGAVFREIEMHLKKVPYKEMGGDFRYRIQDEIVMELPLKNKLGKGNSPAYTPPGEFNICLETMTFGYTVALAGKRDMYTASSEFKTYLKKQ